MLVFSIVREIFIKGTTRDSVTAMFKYEEYSEKVFDFMLDVFNRIHFAIPNLKLKEIFIGFIMSKSTLLYPYYPTAEECPSIQNRVFRLGYNFTEKPTREPSVDTFG